MLQALHTNNSPFSEPQLRDLQRSIGALDRGQAQWLSGYLAGRLSELPLQTGELKDTEASLTVIVGTETGNGEQLARTLHGELELAGIQSRWISLDRFRARNLRKLKHVAFILSTHGEGDPPEDALELWEFLFADRAPRLEGLNYRVLALGDRSYTHFCKAGQDLDRRLEALGATRTAERVDCDVDFEAPANEWRKELIGWATQNLDKGASRGDSPVLSLVPEAPRWTRENPFEATVEKVQPVTAEGSTKDIRHVELSLEGAGLAFEPGDSLGVWAPNREETVNAIIESLGLDAGQTIEWLGEAMTLREALTGHLEITRLSPDVIENYAELASDYPLAKHWEALDADGRKQFMESRQFADLAKAYPARTDAQTLVGLLRPLASRSYSIASSPRFAQDEIHLTVASLHSDAIGIPRTGTASFHLNHGLEPGGTVRVFPEPNRRFRLPEDPAAPVIMIAAGTGIAPYRAFLQQREQENLKSDAWLIFGNPNFRTDFLYQREWLDWRERGYLSRIDVAFSRDHEQKRYVQHVVAEQAERVNAWLQRGAIVYLCGSLDMGKAVMDALEQAIAQQRGLAGPAAAKEIASLRRNKRIRKDLY